jgi:hypothetical protein
MSSRRAITTGMMTAATNTATGMIAAGMAVAGATAIIVTAIKRFHRRQALSNQGFSLRSPCALPGVLIGSTVSDVVRRMACLH